jgi:hypothetical protein
MAIASAGAGLASYEVVRIVETHIAWRTTHGALIVLIVASVAGFIVAGIGAKLLRIRELDSYLAKLSPWFSHPD